MDGGRAFAASAHHGVAAVDDAGAVRAADKTWAGNLDLAGFDADGPVNLSATWMTPAGLPIDSDRVLVIPDPTVPVDPLALGGQGLEESAPGPAALLLVVGFASVVGLVRSRRRRP